MIRPKTIAQQLTTRLTNLECCAASGGEKGERSPPEQKSRPVGGGEVRILRPFIVAQARLKSSPLFGLGRVLPLCGCTVASPT